MKGRPVNPFRISGHKARFVVSLLACLLAVPPSAYAKSPVKMTKLEGLVDTSAGRPAPYVLEGVASHLGRYQAYGEVELVPGDEEGSLAGTGPVVFQSADGDLLVGVATWEIDPPLDGVTESRIHFAWRDLVEFSDGRVVSSTGRFVSNRPPGLVVGAVTILNILILIVLRS